MTNVPMPGVRPSNYGVWWNTNDKEVAWYQGIHDGRQAVHDEFIQWIGLHDRPDDPIRSALEIGCGRGVRYPALFADKRYVGYDISKKEIEWCRSNRHNPRHGYVLGDFIAESIPERFDLVFAHAVIDHVYDIDAFLRAVVAATNRWVYLTSYRGWFPELREHRYTWNDQDTCFFNDVAPARLQSVLADLGCSFVRVAHSAALVEAFGWETVIVAERSRQPVMVPKADEAWLRRSTVCPACLESGILGDRRDGPEGAGYRCARCHRVYPVDQLNGPDFQVHDRLASLPEGALEMWALANRRSFEDQRHGGARPATRDSAARAFAGFIGPEGGDLLAIGSGADEPPTYLNGRQIGNFATLGPESATREVPHTTVQAWAELMPFADETFDAVICGRRSLEVVLCLESALLEIHRVLRRDGALYVWLPFASDARGSSGLFPRLLARPAGDVLAEDEGARRRAGALEEEARRIGDLPRLEREFGHLPSDRSRVRFVPIRLLRTLPSYGLRPEEIHVWDHDYHSGVVAVNAFVRVRKSDSTLPLDRTLLNHIDLLSGTATGLEHVTGEIERLKRAVGEIKTDFRREVARLRESLDYPRTPFERVYRLLSNWWHRRRA